MSGLLVTANAPTADPEGAQTRRDMLGGYLIEYQRTEQEIVRLEAWLRKSDARLDEGRVWLCANRDHPTYEEHYRRWSAWGNQDFLRTCAKKDLEAKNAARAARAIQVWDRMSAEERAEWFPNDTDLPGWVIWTRLRDGAMKDGKAGPDVPY